VRHALLRTPCDVVQEPTSMRDAARRIASLIPPVTPFRVLEQARRDLGVAIEQLEAQGVHATKAAHEGDQEASAQENGVMGTA
jgi:hypothetical protein